MSLTGDKEQITIGAAVTYAQAMPTAHRGLSRA